MARENNVETLDTWELLSTSMEANAAQFPNLEESRVQLTQTLGQARELVVQQAALTADKQEVSKRLRVLLGEGRKLATFLRFGVKQKLGNRSERVIEFGLRPLRPRKVKPTTTPESPPRPE
jgi:hypothetical protein